MNVLAVHTLHFCVLNIKFVVVQFPLQHTQFVEVDIVFALQFSFLHHPLHAQVQVHGHVHVTILDSHELHKLYIGFVDTSIPFTLQHTQSIANHVPNLFAIHQEFIPPLIHAQVQVHGHVHVTTLAIQVVHKFVVGATANVVQLTFQHTPFKLKFTPSNLQPILDELYQVFHDHQLNCRLQYDIHEL
jgi:hypothetical protein